MKRAIAILAALLTAGPAFAETWVDISGPFFRASVDRDSIRLGPDGLIYFTSETAYKADAAIDCVKGVSYTLKLYVDGMAPIERPNWREEGVAVVDGSAGGAVRDYVCAPSAIVRRHDPKS